MSLSDFARPPAFLLLILASLAAYLVVAAAAFGMPGFAEDMGLTHDLARKLTQTGGWQDVGARWIGPLWGHGSTMWRPWGYTSLALDAVLWGADGRPWHATNLLLHLTASVLTAWIAWVWLRHRVASGLAFAAMLLNPWSAEVTLWLVGRFDGWATVGMVAAVAALELRGRWVPIALSLAAAALGYLSKESTLIMPALITAWIVASPNTAASNRPRFRLTAFVAHLVLALAYLVARKLAVGTSSTFVYGGDLDGTLAVLTNAITAHLGAMLGSGTAWAPLQMACATLALVLSTFGGHRGRRVATAATLWTLAVIAAVAWHFPAPLESGEGKRLYYAAAPAIALLFAAAAVGVERTISSRAAAPSVNLAAVVTSALIAPGAASLLVSTSRWTEAAASVDRAADAIAIIVARHAEDRGYGLVLVPDRFGAIPLFRNAQGGLLQYAGRRHPELPAPLDYAVPMTDQQIAEWQGLLTKEIVRVLTPRGDAPARPTRLWCIDTDGTPHPQPVPDADDEAWRRALVEVRLRCGWPTQPPAW